MRKKDKSLSQREQKRLWRKAEFCSLRITADFQLPADFTAFPSLAQTWPVSLLCQVSHAVDFALDDLYERGLGMVIIKRFQPQGWVFVYMFVCKKVANRNLCLLSSMNFLGNRNCRQSVSQSIYQFCKLLRSGNL